MKSLKFLAALTAIFLASFSLHAELVFETNTIEVQGGLLDKQSEAEFRFTNNSDQAVVITSLKSSCGCTVPQLEKREYAPGESGEIKAVFNFGSRRGLQNKQITVATPEKTYRLNFITRIPEWASIDPQILRWKAGDPKAPKEVRLKIALPDQVKLIPPNMNLQHFTVMETKVDESEWVYSLMPKNTDARVTERVLLRLEASEGDTRTTRELAFHCLVR
jgi:hypothetical protein